MNEQIAQIFDEIADMLEILDESVFRIRAYRRAAETVRGTGLNLKEVPDEEIEAIPGIGKDLHAKIVEINETGRCQMHEDLAKKLSPGILDILRVRGIGPKKAKMFYQQLDIDNLDKLKAAAESGALATLPRMGEKTVENILEAMEQGTHERIRTPYAQAKKVADAYLDYMRECGSLDKVQYAGSLRREKETIGDVDILATGSDAAAMSKHFLEYSKVKTVLAAGDTKSSVVLEDGNIQVDFRVVEPESFGAALLYFTGSKHFNIMMRTRALRNHLKINEYGIYKGEQKLAGESEEDMFKALGMDYVEPRDREEGR